jgi:hypothetical protein
MQLRHLMNVLPPTEGMSKVTSIAWCVLHPLRLPPVPLSARARADRALRSLAVARPSNAPQLRPLGGTRTRSGSKQRGSDVLLVRGRVDRGRPTPSCSPGCTTRPHAQVTGDWDMQTRGGAES